MFHAGDIKFNVSGILKTFWFLGELNKASMDHDTPPFRAGNDLSPHSSPAHDPW